MNEDQKIDVVLRDQPTLKQMSEGLLDGSDELRLAGQDSPAHSDPSFDGPPEEADEVNGLAEALTHARHKQPFKARPRVKAKIRPAQAAKQRFGLPEGFVSRLQRRGSVLLEQNVYRLPTGQEFIPCRPVGTLGARQHMYALLTTEQYLKGKRGSVYVRSDGRIFDYSVDSANPIGDFFDTGYTIYNLERTGRYAPEPRKKRKRTPPPKYRSAAAAG